MANKPFIEEKGGDVAARHLRQMASRGDDMRPFFRDMNRLIARLELGWFNTRGRGAWRPLEQKTIDRKAREGLSSHPMVATGALRNSLIVEGRARGGRRRATKTSLAFGTTLPYARYHMWDRPPLVPMNEATRRGMRRTLADYLMAPYRKGREL